MCCCFKISVQKQKKQKIRKFQNQKKHESCLGHWFCVSSNGIIFAQTKQLRVTADIRKVLPFFSKKMKSKRSKKQKEQSRANRTYQNLCFNCSLSLSIDFFCEKFEKLKNEDLKRSHPSEQNLSQLMISCHELGAITSDKLS